MLARLTQLATRAAPSLSAAAPSWSRSVRHIGTSVFEAHHRIFGDSLNRDPSPFKALANLQSAGGFTGPKARAHCGRHPPVALRAASFMLRAAGLHMACTSAPVAR
jgi:hypothetical protein